MTIKKKAGRGGKRKGAGRKPKWPTGTELKTMRLPACLEKEIFQYAQKRIGELNQQSSTQTKANSSTMALSRDTCKIVPHRSVTLALITFQAL